MGESPDHDERRRLYLGAAAKVGVLAVVVGLLVALGTLGLVKALGLDDGGSATPTGSSPPSPLPTKALDAPSASASAATTQGPPRSTPAKKLTLSAPTTVGSMQRIDLSGRYPGHAGALLHVQRLEGGQWQDFAGITVTVHAGAFSTYVQTGHAGANVFRVWDDEAKLASNKVAVSVG